MPARSMDRKMAQGCALHPLCGRQIGPWNDNRPAFPLVRAYVEPPAGIEPATPSLPWMCSAD
jgi:hypothetical protein